MWNAQSSLILLHDNDRPHAFGVTQNLIQQFGWELFDHLLYNFDLTPSDYNLILTLKLDFEGRTFVNDDDTKTVFSSGCFH